MGVIAERHREKRDRQRERDTLGKQEPGRHPSDEWQERYLAYYREHGGQYRSARTLGIRWATVYDEIHRNPDFARALAEAREEFADQCETRMLDLGERSNNPVPYIVRLKALRPSEYIEKQVSVNVNATADLDDEQTAQLVSALVHSLRESSGSAVATPLPSRETPALSEGSGPVLDVAAERSSPAPARARARRRSRALVSGADEGTPGGQS